MFSLLLLWGWMVLLLFSTQIKNNTKKPNPSAQLNLRNTCFCVLKMNDNWQRNRLKNKINISICLDMLSLIFFYHIFFLVFLYFLWIIFPAACPYSACNDLYLLPRPCLLLLSFPVFLLLFFFQGGGYVFFKLFVWFTSGL